jgi:hypothetical protein
VWELVVPWLLSWFTDLYPLSALGVHQEFGLVSIYPQRFTHETRCVVRYSH